MGTVSWAGVLRELRDRGLAEAPLLGSGDGALGFWAALGDVYPATRHQRCWNHCSLNVLDKLPRRLHAATRPAMHAMYSAGSRAECTRQRAELCVQLRAQGQADACWGARKVHRPDQQKCTGLEAHATIAPPPLSFCLAV